MKKETITPYEANINFRKRQKELKRKRRDLYLNDDEHKYIKLALTWYRKTQVESND